MIKPMRLVKGDKVAIVSLSWGGIGDDTFIHKYYLGKKRLEEEFGLEVIAMPNALKGSEFIKNHPELRAKDLMDAFLDSSIKGIICSIGGSDTIRITPYIDYEIIKNNPKIFMGFSDTTANHFMMQKAGIVSYYGPCLMQDFAEYGSMFDYTKESINNILFEGIENLEIKSSEYWTDDYVEWKEENINITKKLKKEELGYELLQGKGKVKGKLLGGCLDAFPLYVGTSVWPTLDDWKDKILFIETSEEEPSPELINHYLMNLGAQGIFNVIKGIIVGKPYLGKYYEEYKKVLIEVLKDYNKEDLPVLYNINCGHSLPIGILPIGTEIEVDFDNKKIILTESPVKKLIKT